jgi:aryl-alcohol dehydrogenase-like predicted oxidoreductase
VDEPAQERVVRRALEMGITLIDTADAYGAGRMEQVIGRALRAHDGGHVVVVTKGGTDRATSPARKRFDRAYLRERVEGSLRRLERDRVDVYLLHNPTEAAVRGGEAVDALLELKREGKIAHWGVSVGSIDVGRAALAKGAEVIEIAYNLLQSRDLHRLAGEVMVAGAGVLARSTLAYGLLAGNWTADKTFAETDHRSERWTKFELEQRLNQVASVLWLVTGDEVRTMRSAAVRFVLANNIVSAAVLGPRSVAQLEDVVREIGMGPIYLRDDDLMLIPRSLEAVGIEP